MKSETRRFPALFQMNLQPSSGNRTLVLRIGRMLLALLAALPALQVQAAGPGVRISQVAENGMPENIVSKGAQWNFGPGSLWTYGGWQYAAYWDDNRQVSVARRELPTGEWSVVSLPGYRRSESGDRGAGGAVSQGFGDGHEKVAMGISPDGFIHLSFDQHLSTLRYRTSILPIAKNPDSHSWTADLFGPVRDNLGGPRINSVTYPSFYSDGSHFLLYLRLGGGSGSANSHLFSYKDGMWTVNSEVESRIIDKKWSGGNGTVNAYPFGLVFRNGRCHLSWCWRDTPVPNTCHDLCYAYSDDYGGTWRNNAGIVIGERGVKPITADSPGISVRPIPAGRKYINNGSMTVDAAGRVYVLARVETGKPTLFQRDPETAEWSGGPVQDLGSFVTSTRHRINIFSGGSLYRFDPAGSPGWETISRAPLKLFSDCNPVVDAHRFALDGWISVIGQRGKAVAVVDFQVPPDEQPGCPTSP